MAKKRKKTTKRIRRKTARKPKRKTIRKTTKRRAKKGEKKTAKKGAKRAEEKASKRVIKRRIEKKIKGKRKRSGRMQVFLAIVAIMGVMALSYLLFPGAREPLTSPLPQTEVESDITGGEELEPEQPSLSIENVSIVKEKPDKSRTINVQYPTVFGLQDEEKEKAVNEEIEDYVLAMIVEFEEEAGEEGASEEMKDSLYMEYFVSLLNEQSVSIKFLRVDSFAGAAHPIDYILSFNYDIAGGEQIELKDVFKEDVDYMSILSVLTIKKLVQRFEGEEGMEDWISTGAAPEFENYKNFGFSENALIIYFGPYQVAPYAMGPQVVEIAYEELRGQINPEGPLGYLIPKD